MIRDTSATDRPLVTPIRDTSAQDRPVAAAPVPVARRWLWPALGVGATIAEVARQRIHAEEAKLIAQRDADEAEVARLGAERILQRTEKGHAAGAIAEVDLLRAQDAMKSAQIRANQAAKAAHLEGADVALE